jgi:hypothetical protein
MEADKGPHVVYEPRVWIIGYEKPSTQLESEVTGPSMQTTWPPDLPPPFISSPTE